MSPPSSFEVKPPFPPGDPRWGELAFLRMGTPEDRVWRRMDKFGRRCRRAGTYRSPLAFAIVYLTHSLQPVQPLTPEGEPEPGTVPMVSFSDFHLALCDEAKTWMQPRGRRTGIIAPRGAGKSVWTYLILPIWALAYGHRKSFMGYANSDKQAVKQMDKIRYRLQHSELLRFDFPELDIPKGARNNSHTVETACTLTVPEIKSLGLDPDLVLSSGGRTFSTSGIDSISLGERSVEDVRPDLITIDDGEPDEGNYKNAEKKGSKEVRLKTIRDVVLPMEPAAAVLLSGTVVMPNSIGHDLVKAALGEPTEDWVAQERFRAMYFNAIQDEGTPAERSLWPEKWSLEGLRYERDNNPAQYALHFANQPMTRGGDYWQEEDFRYDPHFPVDHYVLYVDPAVVNKPGRDKTAVVVASADAGRYRAVVEVAFQRHMTKVDLGKQIALFKRGRPDIGLLDVYIEKNNGGELYSEIIEPLVRGMGIRLHLVHTGAEVSATGQRGKPARIEAAYFYYQASRVWHRRPFPELQALLTSYPKVSNDDLPDSLAGALRALDLRDMSLATRR